MLCNIWPKHQSPYIMGILEQTGAILTIPAHVEKREQDWSINTASDNHYIFVYACYKAWPVWTNTTSIKNYVGKFNLYIFWLKNLININHLSKGNHR